MISNNFQVETHSDQITNKLKIILMVGNTLINIDTGYYQDSTEEKKTYNNESGYEKQSNQSYRYYQIKFDRSSQFIYTL